MNTNNKIAIVSASLGIGGAERFASLLSFILSDLGYEVHNLIITDKVDYQYRGELINLGEIFRSEKGIFKSLKKGKFINDYLARNDINIIIDNRSRPFFHREIFTKIIYSNRKKVFIVHSSNLEMYLSGFAFGAKYLYKNADKLVCVSKAIEEKLKKEFGFNNTQTIYNPVLISKNSYDKPVGLPENYFLFFGRIEENVKNFSLLLDSYKKSSVYERNFKLVIIGDGSDKELINTKIKALGLSSDVLLLPFVSDIQPYIQHAFCTLLTSHFEGFPMAIIESLAVGTPVISVDCPTGPSEIIQNRLNGLLVPNYDVEAFSRAMQAMIDENDLYQSCKMYAQKSVEHLSLDKIALQWKKLLIEL